PPGLNQHLEHLTLGIDGAPEIHLLAADPDEHLVEVPAPVRRRPPCTKTPSDCGTEADHPTPDRLVRHLDATLGEQVLDVAVAQGEAEIHPDGALDHVRWKSVAGIVRRGHWLPLRRAPALRKAANVTSPDDLLLLLP